MPTLVETKVPYESDDSQVSETILFDDESGQDFLDGLETNRNKDEVVETQAKKGHQQNSPPSSARGQPKDFASPMLEDQSITILSQTLLHDETILLEPTPNKSTQRDQDIDEDKENVVVRHPIRGNSEETYFTKYRPRVQKILRDFDHLHPGRLVDYRSLSRDQQRREQDRVEALLRRLGIGKRAALASNQENKVYEYQRCQHASQKVQPSVHQHVHDSMDDSLPFIFSPDCHQPPTWEQEPEQPDVGDYNAEKSDSDSSHIGAQHCSDSVELVRGTSEASISSHAPSVYHSPAFTPKGVGSTSFKRPATSSAKRGADFARSKLNNDIEDDYYSPDRLSRRMGRLSISPKADASPQDLFVASQSPISPRLTYASDDDHGESQEQGFARIDDPGGLDSDVDLDSPRSQTTRRTEYTIGTFLSSKRNGNSRLMLGQCKMKEGTQFHLEKLAVKRNLKYRVKTSAGEQVQRRLVDFPDPLRSYNSRIGRALNEIFKCIQKRENKAFNRGSDKIAANVIFSLSTKQIMDLSLKVLLTDNGRYMAESALRLNGGSVIVTRTKEESQRWAAALQEGTGFSVLNHATLSLAERIRPTTAERATKFDVVLTTYDALKSADIAIPLDSEGRAIFAAASSDNSWYSSRTASGTSNVGTPQPQACKSLSILHRVHFRRVVFMDVLGRKSFLAKNGTARACAAQALRAQSRVVYFEDSEGCTPITALLKSHRQALHSLEAVLQASTMGGSDENETADTHDSLEQCFHDLQQYI
eukprot:Nitzschia sp. Nitz4//scaffold112_size70979//43352//45712//NITZ4_005906-RA/size70979-processed-gene-0.109-mRNA-1//1//CDS//3329533277//107//frame0